MESLVSAAPQPKLRLIDSLARGLNLPEPVQHTGKLHNRRNCTPRRNGTRSSPIIPSHAKPLVLRLAANMSQRERSRSPRRRSRSQGRQSRRRSFSPRSRSNSRDDYRRGRDRSPMTGTGAPGGGSSAGFSGQAPHRSYEERSAAREQMMNNIRETSQQDRRVYVGNLSYDVKWHHLKDFMRQGTAPAELSRFKATTNARSYSRRSPLRRRIAAPQRNVQGALRQVPPFPLFPCFWLPISCHCCDSSWCLAPWRLSFFRDSLD